MSGSFDSSKRYRVEPRGGVHWQAEDECLLGISVGQPAHEGDKFCATIAWASTRFSRIHIWIADTLHRHNLPCETPEKSLIAHEQSRQEGDLWLERNAMILSSVSIPLTVSRWDDWLNDPRYPPSRLRMQELYDSHADLRSVVERDAGKYLQRPVRQRVLNGDSNLVLANCIELILEECAVFCLLLADHPGVDIYPGSELETTRYFRSNRDLDEALPLSNRRFARILFRRRRD